MTDKLYKDEAWLREQYWGQKKSIREIAKIAGCSGTVIRTWMDKFGIPRRPRVEALRLAQDDEWRRKQAEGARAKFQDPEHYKKIAEANRRKAQDPEWLKKATEVIHRRFRDPEYRKKHAEIARRNAKNPERNKKLSESLHRKFEDPEYREKRAEMLRERAQDPEYRKKHAEAMRHLHQNPEYCQKRDERIRRLNRDPEFRRKHTEAMRRRAKDPEWQKRHAEFLDNLHTRLALKKRGRGEKTNIESICYDAFESLELEFIFEKPLRGKIIDFFFPSHGVIVEALGEYWHRLPGKREGDAERKEFLEACGYVVLEWWGNDIKADVWKLIDEELLPLLEQPSRIERLPNGVIKPYKGKGGWESATQLALTL